MDSHVSPARAKEKGVHDRGPNEDNSSPNKAAKKKQRQAEEPMEVDDQVPSIMKTPKYTASAKLGFLPALTEYRYDVQDKPSAFWTGKYPTPRKHVGVEGFDTSNAAQRSIEVRCKEVAEILNEVKGRRD